MNFKERLNKIKGKKSNSGITLVTLIITIVVMIILSTVVISQINSDGVLEKAKETEESYYLESNNIYNKINKIKNQ